MRKLAAAVMFAVTGAMITLTGLSFANLGDRHQDGPDSQFILVAAGGLPIALLSAALGAWALRNSNS